MGEAADHGFNQPSAQDIQVMMMHLQAVPPITSPDLPATRAPPAPALHRQGAARRMCATRCCSKAPASVASPRHRKSPRRTCSRSTSSSTRHAPLDMSGAAGREVECCQGTRQSTPEIGAAAAGRLRLAHSRMLAAISKSPSVWCERRRISVASPNSKDRKVGRESMVEGRGFVPARFQAVPVTVTIFPGKKYGLAEHSPYVAHWATQSHYNCC